MMKKQYSIFALFWLVVSALVFVSCSDDDETQGAPGDVGNEMARRMTLVYIMAENSLSDYAEKDVNEMYSAATLVPEDCRLLVFIDDKNKPRIYNIYSKNGATICDTVHTFEHDFCSSDTANMRKVFDYVYEKYPAESMNLVMWSHGSGWVSGEKLNSPIMRSIGVDNENNTYSNTATTVIEIEELADFIKSLPIEVELLMFDACFMQTVETAYALRDAVDWILASPAEIPGNGAPYHRIIEPLFSFPLNVEAVMNEYYEEYKNEKFGVLLSLVQCDAMQEFAECTAEYIPRAFNRSNNIEYSSLFSYLPGGYFFDSKAFYPDFIDINSAMKEYLADAEYFEWKKLLNKAVPYVVSSPSWYSAPKHRCYVVNKDVYSGISFYIPRESSEFEIYNRDFANTEWYRTAGWKLTGW